MFIKEYVGIYLKPNNKNINKKKTYLEGFLQYVLIIPDKIVKNWQNIEK